MRHRPTALRLHAPLALLGVVATLAAAAAVLGAILLGEDAAHAIDHRHEPLLVHLLFEWPLVSALAVLVGVAALRGVRVLLAHARAALALRPALAAARPRTLDGATVAVLDDPRPAAFCSGLLRPRVYVSTGALEALDPAGLHALLAHERAHARRRDPLRRLLGELLARSLFFLPVMEPLSARRAALAELDADAAAVAACDGDVRPLAAALLAFEQAQRSPLRIDPERIDSLAGMQRAWTPPPGTLAAAPATLALALACPVMAIEHTTGRLLHVSPFGVELCLAALLALPCVLAAALLLSRLPRAEGTIASAR